MKRILIFTGILTLSLALFACGGDESKAAQTDTTATTEAPPLPADVQAVSTGIIATTAASESP